MGSVEVSKFHNYYLNKSYPFTHSTEDGHQKHRARCTEDGHQKQPKRCTRFWIDTNLLEMQGCQTTHQETLEKKKAIFYHHYHHPSHHHHHHHPHHHHLHQPTKPTTNHHPRRLHRMQRSGQTCCQIQGAAWSSSTWQNY